MQNAAILRHVSLLASPEQKALALGMVGLVRVVPVVFFSMHSGVVADVWNRRKLMLLTKSAAAVFATFWQFLPFTDCPMSGRSMCSQRLAHRRAHSICPYGPNI
jgi:hypothetical protein